MKTLNFFFILLVLFISSCGEDANTSSNGEFGNGEQFSYENNQNQNGYNGEQNGNSGNRQQNSNGFNKQSNYQSTAADKKAFKLKDGQGQVFGYYPIPKNWNQGSGDHFLESKDGVAVTNDLVNEFMHSHIPDYNQMLRENKVQVKPVKSLERFIKEDIAQLAQAEGIKITNIVRTPAITQINAQRDKVWFKSEPEQMSFDSAIVDFVDEKGGPSFILINYYVGSSQNCKRWGFIMTGVEAPRAIFEQTKKDYLYAVMNAKLDPKYVQMTNQKNARASQKNAVAHQGRMQQIRDFSAQNTKNFNARGAQFDAQNNAWRAGQASSDRMQRQTINSISEVSTYKDGSGNSFEVDGFHNKVFTNGNGEYIGTDDWNANPNTNPNVEGNWEELQIKDDNGWNY